MSPRAPCFQRPIYTIEGLSDSHNPLNLGFCLGSGCRVWVEDARETSTLKGLFGGIPQPFLLLFGGGTDGVEGVQVGRSRFPVILATILHANPKHICIYNNISIYSSCMLTGDFWLSPKLLVLEGRILKMLFDD